MANLKLIINQDKRVTFGSKISVNEVYSNTINRRIDQLSASMQDIVVGSSNFKGSYTTDERLALDTASYSIGDWVYDTDINSPYYWNGEEWT